MEIKRTMENENKEEDADRKVENKKMAANGSDSGCKCDWKGKWRLRDWAEDGKLRGKCSGKWIVGVSKVVKVNEKR